LPCEPAALLTDERRNANDGSVREHAPDELARVDMSDDEAAAYDRTVWRLAERALTGHCAEGMLGTAIAVRLEGTRPESRLVIRYRSRLGGEFGGTWTIWNADEFGTHGLGPSPNSMVGVLIANWDEGAVRAPDDPHGR